MQSLSHFTIGPQLDLIKQTSLAEEVISKNGIQKQVHAVVKNAPFDLIIQGASPTIGQSIDFNTVALKISLLYDCEECNPVHFIKKEPVSYKPIISQSGDKVTLTCRIKVLSSQHEGMFFRVGVCALEPMTKQAFNPPLEIISQPIRVISKPEQVKGARKRTQPAKKSAMTILKESVQRLEIQQQQHERLIRQLLAERTTNVSNSSESSPLEFPTTTTTTTTESSSSLSSSVEQVSSPGPVFSPLEKSTRVEGEGEGKSSSQKDTKGTKEEFVQVFNKLLDVYRALEPAERPTKLRRVVRERSFADKELLGEFVDIVSSEGLERPLGAPVSLSSFESVNTTTCGDYCPHKLELEKLDSFYDTFLS